MKSLVRAFVAAALVLHANANLAANCSCAGDRCFSAVRTSVDIRSALRACQEKGGRLATQSPESKVALYPLLDGVQGEFWTGLMLPNEKCTEATRRRSWTAELEATDFTEQTGTGSPCSPLCLSLSKDLMLTERSCEDRVDGYICVYSQVSKCGPLSLEFDKVVLYNSSEHNSLGPCSINAGSIAVHLPSRVKHVCDPDGLWVQAPWGCEFEMGGCQHGCVVHNSVPQCICPPHKVLESNNLTCTESSDDLCTTLKCDHYCLASFGCYCKPGYELKKDGKTCKDTDECLDDRICKDMICDNKEGSFLCRCPSGFIQENQHCVDINECIFGPCEHSCNNTIGSYHCSCREGYVQDPKTKEKCILHCPSQECPAICDPNNVKQCECPPGFILDERDVENICVDINECEMGYCDQNCVNTNGSFLCSCYSGYYLDGDKCRKKNVTESSTFVSTTTAYGDSSTPTVTAVPGGTSSITPGGIVGIVLCVLVIILVLFLVHRKRWTIKSVYKTTGEHMKDLQQVTVEDNEKLFANKHENQNSS